MEQPGRKSAEALANLSLVSVRRPEPPPNLNAKQAALWRSIVATKPPDWFLADTLPLLEAYIIAIGLANTLQTELDKFGQAPLGSGKNFAKFRRLVSMHQQQVKMLTTLATKLRITQQSRLDKNKAASQARNGGPGKVLPWQTA